MATTADPDLRGRDEGPLVRALSGLEHLEEVHLEEVPADLDHLVSMGSPSTDKTLLDDTLTGIEAWPDGQAVVAFTNRT